MYTYTPADLATESNSNSVTRDWQWHKVYFCYWGADTQKNDSYSLKVTDLKSANKFCPIEGKGFLSKLVLNYRPDTGPFDKITKGPFVKQPNQMIGAGIGASELRLIALEGSQLEQ